MKQYVHEFEDFIRRIMDKVYTDSPVSDAEFTQILRKEIEESFMMFEDRSREAVRKLKIKHRSYLC